MVYRVDHPAKIRAAETRHQKHDRRDARLMLELLMREDGFAAIWMPSSEQRDLRTLLRDRYQWAKMRTYAPKHSLGNPSSGYSDSDMGKVNGSARDRRPDVTEETDSSGEA
jgi:hypothetical protein